MFSQLTSRTAKTIKNSQLLKTQLIYNPKNYFAFASRDFYEMLNLSKHPTKNEIINAYHAKLSELSAKAKPIEESEQVRQLRDAYEEAMRSLDKKLGTQPDSSIGEKAERVKDVVGDKAEKMKDYVQDTFANNQPKRGWFRQMLDSDSGKKESKDEKKWGMKFFLLSGMGIAGIYYLMGSNLMNKPQTNSDKTVHRNANNASAEDATREQNKKDNKSQSKAETKK